MAKEKKQIEKNHALLDYRTQYQRALAIKIDDLSDELITLAGGSYSAKRDKKIVALFNQIHSACWAAIYENSTVPETK